MRAADLLHLAAESLFRARLRSVMMLIAMSIGVAAVVVLTSLGEGARRYVTGEFQALGTDLLIVLPGRSETTGVQPGLFAGETPRDLTLDDARALLRVPTKLRLRPHNKQPLRQRLYKARMGGTPPFALNWTPSRRPKQRRLQSLRRRKRRASLTPSALQ